jgi:hypothetical protein
MLTIVETEAFTALWPDYWSEDEFGEFCAWLARNPDAGDVVPESDGCRKVRWSLPGTGKRGGARVIYFNKIADGEIWLLTMYAKSDRATVPGRELKVQRRRLAKRQETTGQNTPPRRQETRRNGKTHRKGANRPRR